MTLSGGENPGNMFPLGSYMGQHHLILSPRSTAHRELLSSMIL